jgi:hypothetical protein
VSEFVSFSFSFSAKASPDALACAAMIRRTVMSAIERSIDYWQEPKKRHTSGGGRLRFFYVTFWR